MRISLSNSAPLSVPRLQQWWEQWESLLLSNTFAPRVKDKEHRARPWGGGCPGPVNSGGLTSGQSTEKCRFHKYRGWGGKFLNFPSFSLDHFSFPPKVIWPNRQRHGWQTHNLGFQDWSETQIYLLDGATLLHTLLWFTFFPLKRWKLKSAAWQSSKKLIFLNSIIKSSATTNLLSY